MTKHLTNALAPLDLRIAAADAALAYADTLAEMSNTLFVCGASSSEIIAAANASSSAYSELKDLCHRLAQYS